MYMSDDKPIGWWLKRVDGLLEHAFDEALAREGLTRRHWQLLNVLGDGVPAATGMAPFLPADPAARDDELARLVADLRARRWIDADGLRAEGVTARERIGAAVARLRKRATEGVPGEDYARVVATLRRMADNLADSVTA